ncbi:MAG: YbaK/EbsC family protein [Anaerolineales bacterium]
MPITNNVTRMLAAKGIPFKAHELPEEKLGGVEAAGVLKVERNQVFKTIVALPGDGGKPILALVPAPKQVDLKLLGRALGSKKMQLATQAQAEKLTGLKVGGISPLALIGGGFTVVMDDSAFLFNEIYLSGGQRGLNISLSPKAIQELTRARTASICNS